MRTCKCLTAQSIGHLANMIPYRDGKDPKTISEQILAIAPIIPGQPSDHKFEIPPHHNNAENPTQAQSQPPLQKSAGNANLIEFGSDSRPRKLLGFFTTRVRVARRWFQSESGQVPGPSMARKPANRTKTPIL